MNGVTILYVSYSCLPNKGSEEKLGWNISVESAKTNRVIVVTKEEHREKITAYLQENPIENIEFHYVDIPGLYKKIYKGAAYSLRLNIWHKRAFPLVEKLCREKGVDVIHQITPIEFRSIGKYYTIPNTKFVCGPLGGGECVPKGLKGYAASNFLVELAHSFLNVLYKAKYKITKQLDACDYFFFTNKETQDYIADLVKNKPQMLYSDTGIDETSFSEISKSTKEPKEVFVFLVAGRMAYRKGHRLLLDALKEIPKGYRYQVRFVGEGPEMNKLKKRCRKYGLDQTVVFTGKLPFTQMAWEYDNAHVFVMPSIRETSGAVLLESASKNIPVIALKRFGGPILFDETAGYFLEGNSRKEYIDALKNAMIFCMEHPEDVAQKAQNACKVAQTYTWSHKLEVYNGVYQGLVENADQDQQ